MFSERAISRNESFEKEKEYICKGGKPQPQLVRAHPCRRCAGCKQIQLLVFNPILHIPSAAVELFIEPFISEGVDVCHDKPGVRAFLKMFSFGNNIPLPAPAFLGSIAKPCKDSGGFICFSMEFFGCLLLGFDDFQKSWILGQTHHIVDLKVFTAFEDALTTESRVPPKNDSYLRETGADLFDKSLQNLFGAGTAINLRGTQTGGQQVFS